MKMSTTAMVFFVVAMVLVLVVNLIGDSSPTHREFQAFFVGSQITFVIAAIALSFSRNKQMT